MMISLKIIAYLLLITSGNETTAAICDSTVWYENFNLPKMQGENRLPTKVKPTKYPFAEVCYEQGLPRNVYMYFSERFVYNETFDKTTSTVCSQFRFRDGLYEYWDMNCYPGDSIITFVFLKRAKPSATRWRLLSKTVTLQNQSTWTGPSTNQKSKTYNVEKLIAHPPKLLALIPDTLGKEYYTTVRQFVHLPTRGYAIETYAYNMECDAQRPANRQRMVFTNKACYTLGEGVDCAKYAPWLLEGVREDSVKCNE
jgi:hypothetical protein